MFNDEMLQKEFERYKDLVDMIRYCEKICIGLFRIFNKTGAVKRYVTIPMIQHREN
jgi:hypothetical protein